MKDAPKAPQPPDPAATAQAQAKANRITQITPQGNLFFGELSGAPSFDVGDGSTFTPDTAGREAAFVQETPFQALIRELGEGTGGNLGRLALDQSALLPDRPLTLEGLPSLTGGGRGEFGPGAGHNGGPRLEQPRLPSAPVGVGSSSVPGIAPPGIDFSRAGGDSFSGSPLRSQNAVFQRALGLLDPVFARRTNRLEQELANRGLPIGSEIAGERQREEASFQNEALLSAAFDAIGAGSREDSRQFGLRSAARSQGLQERGILRNQSFNELASLLGLQPVQQASLGNFIPPGAVDVVGPTALAQQARLAQFQADTSTRNAQLTGLFNLAGSLGSAGIGRPS